MQEGPPGKFFFGLVKVGEKGQIVIPKKARDVLEIKPGDSLLVLGDVQQGLALVRSDRVVALTEHLLGTSQMTEDMDERD